MDDILQQTHKITQDFTIQDAHDHIHLAWSLLAKCKSEYPHMRLDIALYVFRKALKKCPSTPELLYHARKMLIFGLCARFIHKRREQDLAESFRLCFVTTESLLNDGGSAGVTQEVQNYQEIGHLIKLGRDAITGFSKSTSPTKLNTVISHLKSSLGIIPTDVHPNRTRALVDLSTVQYFSFCHSSNPVDLDNSISNLQDALKICVQKNFTRFFIALQLCATLTTRLVHGSNVHDLQEAIDTFSAEHDPATGHPFAMAYEHGLVETVQASVGQPATDTTLSLMREVLANRVETAEHYDEILHQLAEELLARFQRSGVQSDLDEALLLNRRALELRPSPHASRSSTLNSLAYALVIRFDQNSQTSDLDELVSLQREALELQPAPHPDRPVSLHNLSVTLASRFKANGSRSDLDGAIAPAKEALELRPFHNHERSVALSTLADAIQIRFKEDATPLDIDEAILLYKDALKILPEQHSSRLETLEKLASALCARFEQNSQGRDIDDAVLFCREALELCLAPHPERSTYLINLSKGLRLRFGQSRHLDDLDEAISVERKALELRPPQHPYRSDSLNGLAFSLKARFDARGQLDDLNEAILMLEEAHDLWPSSSPGMYVCVGELSTFLRIRFEKEKVLNDLDKAIIYYREVIQHQDEPHPDRSVALGNLANALATRFQQSGQLSDLDEAISLARQALETGLPQQPDRPRTFHNLAVKLYTRFQQEKNWKDNDEVIFLERQALVNASASYSLRPDILSLLANAMKSRYEQTNQQADLDEAVSLHRKALEYPDPANDYSMNLATTLIRRSKVPGYESDLDEAILLLRKTVELQPAPHADRSSLLVNLASALGTRAGRADKPRNDDIEEALSLHNESIELLPKSHGYKHTAIFNLGVTYLQAHSITQDIKHLDSAMSSFSRSLRCPSQSAPDRLRTAIIWARHASQTEHHSTFEAYDTTMQGLLQIAALSLDIKSRQDVLRADSDGLARSAAHYAMEHGLADKAIEYLEGGRTVFWSQVLHLRSPFEKLSTVAPALAENLQNIATELEQGSYRENGTRQSDNLSKMSQEAESSRLRRLDEEWSKSLVEVRALEGFEDFLQPHRLRTLQACADKSPVAYLIPNTATSDCLIMTKERVVHVPLPHMPMGRLRALVHMTRVATSQLPILRSSFENADIPLEEELQNVPLAKEERASKRAGDFTLSSDSIFQYVLHILWEEVVRPVITALQLEKSEHPSILQWCPTGVFTFLPIHAAGCYHPSLGPLECTSDYVVSSYVPTVGVLLGARTYAPELDTRAFKMMTVIDTGLPYASVELSKIKARVPNDCLIQLGIPGAPAHADTVYNGLPVSSIVHFACHGTQDRSNPLNSGLHVHKGKLTISRVLQQPIIRGSLAFLCACQTATGDENTPDEAMSIGASLLFAGFRSVVATMWNIADSDGPTVADVFYEELFRGPDGKPTSRPEVNKSSRALHVAVQNLRSTGVEFRRWVPFIHLGE